MGSMAPDRNRIADGFASIASRAGAAILGCRDSGARLKPDGSPVCHADEAAEAVIASALAERFPALPVVSEESAIRAGGEVFVLVDPLDGTVEFLKGSGDYTVNLALIEGGRPTVGCVYAPRSGLLWLGVGAVATRRRITPGAALPTATDEVRLHCRSPAAPVVGMRSASHSCEADQRIGERLGVERWEAAGSSLKFARIAEGAADLYPRLGPIMDWDIAAGDAVLAAAGGVVVGRDGAPVRYGVAGREWRQNGFVAAGALSLLAGLDALAEETA